MPERSYKCVLSVYDSKGMPIKKYEESYFFTKSEDSTTFGIELDPKYSQDCMSFEVTMEGRKIFERSLKVLR